MMMAGPSFLSIIMMIASGGPIAGDDLLGFIDTQTYWRQKNVEMTVAAMTAELKVDAEAGAANPRAAAVRRLMAIRTLGELKNKDALTALTPLLESKDMFVADYAARAIAAIGGKKRVRPPLTAAARQKDLALLPSGCGVVGQASLVIDKLQDMDETLKTVPLPEGMTRDQVLRKMTEMVLHVAERVGNIRLDSITLGVARNVGNHTGYVVVVARGLYDAKAAANVLMPMVKETSEIDGVKVFCPARTAALIFPDDNRVVFAAGPDREALPLQEVISALKAGKTGLQNTPEMARLVKSVDMTANPWAVAEMSDTYRQAPPLAPLKWITLTGRQAAGATILTLVAEATDAQAMSGSLAIVEQGRQEGICGMERSLERHPTMAPMIKPILELLQSVKVVQKDAQATLTATLKGGTSAAMLMPMMMFGASARTVRVQAQPDPNGL